jgi:hypothetical protein
MSQIQGLLKKEPKKEMNKARAKDKAKEGIEGCTAMVNSLRR